MWEYLKYLTCRIFGHKMGERPNLVAFESFNPSKSYKYRICERCGAQELDGHFSHKSVSLMPKVQWEAQFNAPVNPCPPPDAEELNRLLKQIVTGTSGKYRSIDDPWDDLR